MRVHLEQVEKTTGRRPKKLLDQPDCPQELNYIWEWYLEMRSGELLNFTEIKSWSELTNQQLLSWEVDILRTLDRIFWKIINA